MAQAVLRHPLTTFLTLLTLLLCWFVATPVLAAPDEPQHLTKAAAVARGQWLGRGEPAGPRTHVQLPAGFAKSDTYPACFAFRPRRSAACAGPVLASGGPPVDVTTTAGRYPPVYYGVVGLPTLWLKGVASDRVARGVNLLLCALLLTLAALWAREGLLALGLVVAMTPMVLFLSVVVNPSGVEVAAALASWVGLSRLAHDTALPSPRHLAALTGALLALALSRPVSPLWVAVIVLVTGATASRSRLLALARCRRVQVAAAVVTAAMAFQTVWTVAAQATRLFGKPVHVSTGTALSRTLTTTHVSHLFSQMVGRFGWLDTPAPTATVVVWSVVGLVVLAVAVKRGAPRQRAAFVALLLVVVVVPAVLEALSYPRIGFWWQGRYSLPLAVGLPVMATAHKTLRRRPQLLLTAAALTAVGVAQCWTFLLTMARYTVGVGHGLGLGAVRWRTPWLSPTALLVVFCLASCCWAVLVLTALRTAGPRQA